MPTAKGSNSRKHVAHKRKELWVEDGRGADRLYRRATTIDMLPDDVLLEIFNFYVNRAYLVDEWCTLVHVCRRWRHIVFASPRRLNLQLLCTYTRHVKKLLGIWPALPIVIVGRETRSRHWGVTNIIAALKQNDRVCKIIIDPIPSPLLKRFAGMKKPFMELTSLWLRSDDETAPVIPSPYSFLGGSAPRLRTLSLEGIPFPGLPKLLLSAHGLVYLHLWNIPHSGYISPEAMVTVLPSLTSLRSLSLEFQSPRSRPEPIVNRHPSAVPLTYTVLPALTSLHFKGVSEYLEAFTSQIDVPLLNDLIITFFNQLIFDTPLLLEFIHRTEAFKALHRAYIYFSSHSVEVEFPLTDPAADDQNLRLEISCNPVDWQLSSLAQVCNSSLPPLLTLDRLDVPGHRYANWKDADVENTQLLDVLHPFMTVKDLHLDNNLAPRVAAALQELTSERVTEVLPALQNIFVEFQLSGSVQEAIMQFAAARQLLGNSVAVHNWDKR